jgi:GAF domain
VDTAERLFEMLLAGAGRADFDALLEAGAAEALAAGLGEAGLAELRRQHSLALRVRDQMVHQASRESELSALNQTAIDLNEIRDLDRILTAIVQRARRLLGADMTYLSLNDEEHGASYMKVTDGALTPEFRRLRLPLGTGLLGLVAQDGAPYFTDDYQADTRFLHQGDIDDAVAAEQIRAILGVPLIGAGRVMGALLAVHRRVRPFPPREVALLGAFAAQAAVALESARLFGEAREALAALDAANERLQAQNDEIARAAAAHDRLTRVLTEGGSPRCWRRRWLPTSRCTARPTSCSLRRRAPCPRTCAPRPRSRTVPPAACGLPRAPGPPGPPRPATISAPSWRCAGTT